MKDMAQMQAGMSFYGDLPDSYNLVVNTDNSHIVALRKQVDADLEAEIKPLMEQSEADTKQIETLKAETKDKPDAEKEQKVKDLEKAIADNRDKQTEIVTKYAEKTPVVSQLVDLALLANGLLKGADLTAFIHRSISLL